MASVVNVQIFEAASALPAMSRTRVPLEPPATVAVYVVP